MVDFLKLLLPDGSASYYCVMTIKLVELADTETVRVQFIDGKILLVPRALLAMASFITNAQVLTELQPPA